MFNLWGTKKSEQKSSWVQTVFMGALMGVAIGWVLINRKRQAQPDEIGNGSAPTGEVEIDITTPLIDIEPAAPAPEPISQPQPIASPVASTVTSGRDDLKQLKGIGKVFEERLNAAGISTYAQVVETAPERLLDIVGAKAWQKVEPQTWIDQARELMSKR